MYLVIDGANFVHTHPRYSLSRNRIARSDVKQKPARTEANLTYRLNRPKSDLSTVRSKESLLYSIQNRCRSKLHSSCHYENYIHYDETLHSCKHGRTMYVKRKYTITHYAISVEENGTRREMCFRKFIHHALHFKS